MIADMENMRHAEERGAILSALRQDYQHEMTSARSLAAALDLVGHPMTASGLQFSLTYLADAGYVRIWRAKEVAGFRRDRMRESGADAILFAKLLPLGLQLIDGRAPEDPGVRF